MNQHLAHLSNIWYTIYLTSTLTLINLAFLQCSTSLPMRKNLYTCLLLYLNCLWLFKNINKLQKTRCIQAAFPHIAGRFNMPDFSTEQLLWFSRNFCLWDLCMRLFDILAKNHILCDCSINLFKTTFIDSTIGFALKKYLKKVWKDQHCILHDRIWQNRLLESV